MRPIKFRGKMKHDNKWVYGYFVGNNLIYNDEGIIHWFEVLPETVGQFTGLHDKNGVEIYEGDKVTFFNWTTAEYYKLYNDEGQVVYPEQCYPKGTVIWRDYRYEIKDTKGNYYNVVDFSFEVIGNIHERSKK